MLRRARFLLKFENHIFRDAAGVPWLGMDQWINERKPTPPSISRGFISNSQRLVNITFVNELGEAVRAKAEPHRNLAEVAEENGINLNIYDDRFLFMELPYSHMVVSSPHFDRLPPTDFREDQHLLAMEEFGVVHRNSRLIKFLSVSPSMEGMVIVHPLHADVFSINQTSPFTGRIEDKDKAMQPNLQMTEINEPNRAMIEFPSVWECLWKGVKNFRGLWELTHRNHLQRIRELNASR